MRIMLLLAASILLGLSVLSVDAAPDPDLVIYFPMDEGNGSVVGDFSPNGLDGEVIGGAFNWIEGHSGQGLELTATAEIQVPDDPLLDGMQALTLSLWLKQETHQATGVIEKGSGWAVDMSYLIQPWSDQQIYFGIWDTSSRAIAPPGDYPLGEWYHLAGTFDGTTLKLFINGEEKASAKAPVNEVPDTDLALQVGNRFDGVIDDFLLYRRALTEPEIQAVMEGNILPVRAQGNLSTVWGAVKSTELVKR